MSNPIVPATAETLDPILEEETDPSPGRRLPVTGKVAAAVLVLFAIVAIFAPLFTADPIVNDRGRVTEGCGTGNGLPLYDPLNCADRKALVAQRRGIGEGEFTHLLGVDGAGRDVFSQLVIGTRTSLLISFLSVGGALLVGGTLGILGGYFRGRVDAVVGFMFDVFLAYPALILALAILRFLGQSVGNIALTVGIVAVPLLGRIARASTLTWSEREFVTASKALGAKHGRIIIRDILPNVLPAMLSIAFLAFGVVIVTEGSLSIIGLGVPDDVMSWGRVLATGGSNLREFSTMALSAAVVITIAVMALNLFGDAVREKFDVRESAL